MFGMPEISCHQSVRERESAARPRRLAALAVLLSESFER